MTANQNLLMTVIEMQLGFDIPDIQKALIATGNISAQAAIQYLFNQHTSNTTNNTNDTSSNKNNNKLIIIK